MGQDSVKAFRVNGALVQTGRDVLGWRDFVQLAGFTVVARVTVTVTPPVTLADATPMTLGPGDTAPVVSGMSVKVAVRALEGV